MKPKQKGDPPTGKPPDCPSLFGLGSIQEPFPPGISSRNQNHSYNIHRSNYKNADTDQHRQVLQVQVQQNKSRHRKGSVRKDGKGNAESAGTKSRFARCRCTVFMRRVHHGGFPLPFRISRIGSGLYILYLFFFDLSIGRLPVFFTNFKSFFGWFKQKTNFRMQFPIFNPAKSASNRPVFAFFRQVFPFVNSFSRVRQNPRTDFRDRHRMITEGQQRSATGTGGRRTAQSDAPPFNFER